MTFYSDNSSSTGPTKEQPSPSTKITWYFGDGTTVNWNYNDYLNFFCTYQRKARLI